MAYHHHKGKEKGKKFVSAKIRKIKKEGIRGKKVSQKQAVAVALSMAREKGLKVKPKHKGFTHKTKVKKYKT